MGIEPTAQLFQRDAHNPSFESIRSTLPETGCPIDFCVPVNRHFPPAQLLKDIRRDLPDIVKYYPSYADAHQSILAEFINQPFDSVLIANGSTELITLLCSQCHGPFATSIPTFDWLAWHQIRIRSNPPRQSKSNASSFAILEYQWTDRLCAAAITRYALRISAKPGARRK